MSYKLRVLQRDANESVSEAKSLLRAGKKVVAPETSARVRALIDEVTAAKGDAERLTKATDALRAEVDRSLGFLRKSKVREYAESISIAVLVALSIRAFIFEPYKIPSPSMVPTLLVGDRIWVSKGTYGLRIPFSQRYLMRWRDYQRGDIVVFHFPRTEALTRDRIGEWIQRLDHPTAVLPESLDAWRDASGSPPPSILVDGWNRPFRYTHAPDGTWDIASAGADGTWETGDDLSADQVRQSMVSFPDQRRPAGEALVHRCPIDPYSLTGSKTYIKRIIGLAGDTVELRENRLYLNGVALEHSAPRVGPSSYFRGFAIPAKLYTETLPDGGPTYTVRTLFDDESYGPITVPEGQVFAMGDNRDESSDGRCWGLVPEGNIKGHAKFVIFSVGEGGGFDSGRFFSGLE